MKSPLFSLLACLLPLLAYADDNHDLEEASYHGDLATVTALVNGGADVNFQDEIQETALMHAAVQGHADVVQFLLKHGAKTDLVNNVGRTALYWASWQNHDDVVKLLAAAGADANIADKKGVTPLGIIFLFDADTIEALLNDKADPNAFDRDGRTPLMGAVFMGRLDDTQDTIKVLVKHGAKIDQENKDGETALMQAEQMGASDYVQLLKDLGAKEKPVVLRKPDNTPEARDPAYAWALAASAFYTQVNNLSHQTLGFEPESTSDHRRFWKVEILANNWDVPKHADLEPKLKWFSETGDRVELRKLAGWTAPKDADVNSESSKFLSFDLVRYILRVRAAYAAGYLTKAEAWDHIMPVALRLQKAYKSWEEMGADYLEAGALKDPAITRKYRAVYPLLINHNDANSPWTINKWDTPLSPKPAGPGATQPVDESNE